MATSVSRVLNLVVGTTKGAVLRLLHKVSHHNGDERQLDGDVHDHAGAATSCEPARISDGSDVLLTDMYASDCLGLRV